MDFNKVQNSFFFLLIGSVSILFFWMINNFIIIIIWAIIFGIIFFPVYEWLLKKTKNKETVSSLLTIFLILFFIFIPIYFISDSVAKESISIYQNFTVEDSINNYTTTLPYEEKIKELFSTLNINFNDAKNNLISSTKKIALTISTSIINFGKDTISVAASFFIMIYILFFIFKDGLKILQRIYDILPLGNDKESRIFNQFALIIRSIFKGTLIVAIIQGILGGILLYIVGIKIFILLTILMIILSIVPAVGPVLVLLPISLFFLLTGGIWQGFLLIIGMLIISVIDNILRPLLVGNAIKMHDVIITVSMFSGITAFGLTGFILGPVIAGMFITVWIMFEEKYKQDLKRQG